MSFLNRFFKKFGVVGYDEFSRSREDLTVGVDVTERSVASLEEKFNSLIRFILVDCITASRWDSFGMKRGDGDCSGYSIFPGNDVERPVDYITIGDFIRKVRDAGYDYRLLELRSVSDVFGVLDFQKLLI